MLIGRGKNFNYNVSDDTRRFETRSYVRWSGLSSVSYADRGYRPDIVRADEQEFLGCARLCTRRTLSLADGFFLPRPTFLKCTARNMNFNCSQVTFASRESSHGMARNG
jgi:hypothetical protein